jgi:hypothetical protein
MNCAAYYRCGPPSGKVDDYDRVCTKLFPNVTTAQLYNFNLVHDDIRNYQTKGLIDDPKNLENKRLYIYAGLRNFLFTPAQSLSVLKIFERYIKNPLRIMTRVQDTQLLLVRLKTLRTYKVEVFFLSILSFCSPQIIRLEKPARSQPMKMYL